MLTDTQIKDYVCSANAVSLACSGVLRIISCSNCKLTILSQQEFRAWDVESQHHFHSWSRKVPPDYQVTKVTLKVVEEEINNMNNGITRTRSPTFLTENIKKKINTFLPTDKNQEHDNQEGDKAMGKRFKILRVKGNLKDQDEFLWVNSIVPRPTYSTTWKLQLSPKHTAAYRNNTAATHRARQPTHQVTGKPFSLPLNKGWFLAQVGSSTAFVFPSYRKSGQWCCTGLHLLKGPEGRKEHSIFLFPPQRPSKPLKLINLLFYFTCSLPRK